MALHAPITTLSLSLPPSQHLQALLGELTAGGEPPAGGRGMATGAARLLPFLC